MKNIQNFIKEAHPRWQGVDPNPNAKDVEKELAAKDTSKEKAVKRATQAQRDKAKAQVDQMSDMRDDLKSGMKSTIDKKGNNFTMNARTVVRDSQDPEPVEDTIQRNRETKNKHLQRIAQAKDVEWGTTISPSGRQVNSPEWKAERERRYQEGEYENRDDVDMTGAGAAAIEKEEEEDKAERFAAIDADESLSPREKKQAKSKVKGEWTRKRMERAGNAGDPGTLTGDLGRNKALDDVTRKGYGADAPEGFNVPTRGDDIEVKAKPGHRHLFQPHISEPKHKTGEWPHPDEIGGRDEISLDGINYKHRNNKWQQELSADEVSTLVANTADPDEEARTYKGKDGKVYTSSPQVRKAGGENPFVNEPTAENMKTLHGKSLEKALRDGEIDQDTFHRGMKLSKAFDEENAQSVQDLSFSNYAGEVGEDHDAIDAFRNRAHIRTDLGRRGLDGGEKLDAVYGGVFDDDLGELAAKYQVDGAPEGVYNTRQLDADRKKGKGSEKAQLKALYDQIFSNRERETIRTYLKQNGQDAYSWWEGKRSIEDMNLEHIQALKNPENPGFDHPDNWVWAGEELNKLKNDGKLTDKLDKFHEPQFNTKPSGKGWAGFRNDQARAQNKSHKEIEKQYFDKAPGLSMNAGEYAKLTNDEIEAQRKEAAKLGMPEDEIEKQLPLHTQTRSGFGQDEAAAEKERMEKESGRVEEDQMLFRMKQDMGLSSMDDVRNTAKGQQALAQRQAMWAQGRKDKGTSKKPSVAEILHDEEDF